RRRRAGAADRRRGAEQPPVPRDQTRPDGAHHRRGRARRRRRADERRGARGASRRLPRREEPARMSVEGAPRPRAVDATGLNVVVVAGTWHETVTNGLIEGAQRALDAAGASHSLVRAPGSFELPVISKAVLEAGADAVVALGVIIRGGTPHFEFVSNAATDGLTRVALDTGKPVGFGVLTLDDEQQGLDRAGLEGSHEDKGYEAADAAVRTALLLRAVADLQ